MRDLNDEHRRILWAADRGYLHLNEHGRYTIDDAPRPARKEREELQRWGLIGWKADKSKEPSRIGFYPLIPSITEDGRAALAGQNGGPSC